MATEVKYVVILTVLFVCAILSGNDAGKNSSISTMKMSEYSETDDDGFDDIMFSFLDGDNTVFNQYIKTVQHLFRDNFLGDNLNFLKDIRLKCLPKVYMKLRKLKHSDFINCQHLNNNLIDVFGKRILETCKKTDSFLNCLNEAQQKLRNDLGSIEEDIIGLYLNEIVGGRDTCMGDIIKQLKTFSAFVQQECL